MISPRMRSMLAIVIGAINTRTTDIHGEVQRIINPPPPREEIDGLLNILAMVGFEPGVALDTVETRIRRMMRRAAGHEDPTDDDEPPF